MTNQSRDWTELKEFIRSNMSRWQRFKMWFGYRKARREFLRGRR